MKGFVYYVEGVQKIKDVRFWDCGLGHLEGLEFSSSYLGEVEHCPVVDGERVKQGLLFADRRTMGMSDLEPRLVREWRVMPDALMQEGQRGRRVLVGVQSEKPGPSQLARERVMDGEMVAMGDGNNWYVPHARLHRVNSDGNPQDVIVALPTRSRLNYQTGMWERGGLAPAHAVLWEIAMRWMAERDAAADATPDGTINLTWNDAHKAAASVIAVNYLVGEVECDLLGLFDEHEVRLVMQALCDLNSLDAWVKKKLRAGVDWLTLRHDLTPWL